MADTTNVEQVAVQFFQAGLRAKLNGMTHDEALADIKAAVQQVANISLGDAKAEEIYQQATGNAEPRQSAPRTLSDLARLAEEHPIVWLVPSTIIEGGIHILHGKEESFKTRLALQLLEALNLGGRFLVWELSGGKRVGFAELEMTETMFKGIAHSFLGPADVKPDIAVLNEEERRAILNGATTKARVAVLAKWAQANRLDVIAIDSAAKLFAPGSNTGSQPDVSDVFSQLQQVGCTVILIAHPRKSPPGEDAGHGNEEIAGSGRFAQDPDIILEMVRYGGRTPKVTLSWGKNRMDFKPNDLPLFFDAVDHRLYPVHPFLHLLPASREQLVEESKRRFKWGRSTADHLIEELKRLRDVSGSPLVVETYQNRRAVFSAGPPAVSLSKVLERSDWNQRTYETEAPTLESSNVVSTSSAGDTPTPNWRVDADAIPTLLNWGKVDWEKEPQ